MVFLLLNIDKSATKISTKNTPEPLYNTHCRLHHTKPNNPCLATKIATKLPLMGLTLWMRESFRSTITRFLRPELFLNNSKKSIQLWHSLVRVEQRFQCAARHWVPQTHWSHSFTRWSISLFCALDMWSALVKSLSCLRTNLNLYIAFRGIRLRSAAPAPNFYCKI